MQFLTALRDGSAAFISASPGQNWWLTCKFKASFTHSQYLLLQCINTLYIYAGKLHSNAVTTTASFQNIVGRVKFFRLDPRSTVTVTACIGFAVGSLCMGISTCLSIQQANRAAIIVFGDQSIQ